MTTPSLSPIESAVEAALERLGDEHQRSAERADDAEHRVFFRRWAGAFRKALLKYLQGTRPEPTPGGAWLVGSATRGGVVHRVTKDGACTCESQNRGCWHAALVTGIEVAFDDLATYGDDGPASDGDDNGTGGASDPLTGLQPGAYVRARVLDAMLERSAARIAELRQAVAAQQPTPAAQPTPADLGRRLTQARRPLMAAYDAETARLASKGELRAELERVQAERAAARACYRVAV